MKLQIMQLGGFMPPYTVYLPVMVNSGTARLRAGSYESSSSGGSSKSSSSSDKGDITNKDLISLVKDLKVLPADKLSIINSLMLFELMSSVPGVVDSSMLATQYLKTVSEINDANFLREKYDKMFDQLLSRKDVMGEIAIGPLNTIYLNKEGQITPVTISEYKLNPEEYADAIPLTNGMMMSYRAYSDPHDVSYLNIVSNAVSMQEVTDMIFKYINGLGHNAESQTTFELRKNSNILSGVKELEEASENNDIVITNSTYAITDTEKKKYNRPQIERALTYIYQALPLNAQALLKYRSVDGSDESMQALIASLVLLKEIYEHDVTKKDSLGDGKTQKSGRSNDLNPDGKSTDRQDNDPVIGFVLGDGYELPIAFNIGNSTPYYVNGRYSVLTEGKDGKLLPAESPYSSLLSSAFKPILDLDNATMGGLLIKDGSKVIIDNPEIIRVDLPLDLKAYAKGICKPDFALSNLVELAEKIIQDGNITDPNEINKICENIGLPEKFVFQDGKWTLNTLKFKSFALIKCKADDLAFEDEDALNPGLIRELHGAEDDNLRGLLSKYDPTYSDSSWFGGGNLYEGYLFVPIRDSVIAASFGSGNYYKLQGNDAIKVAEAEALNKQYTKPPSLADIKNEQ